ncbi:uncharacterized protein TM_0508-like [Amphiura filiformis]|uniref:uncharacterized protein TM_0508-like n=1 Tax=Amphiura filiformis TaxID=82378 RepID=UPI003B21081B
MEIEGEHCLIKYLQGDIKEQDVDAIINFVYPEELLRDANGVFAAAGERILAEFEDEKAKENRLVRRGVIVTSAGNLPFKKIFHVMATHNTAKMKDALHTALRQADREEMRSIAAPVPQLLDQNDSLQIHQPQNISSELVEILGFPRSKAAADYLQIIQDFEKNEKPVCLRVINVLVPASPIEIKEHQAESSLRGFSIASTRGEYQTHHDYIVGLYDQVARHRRRHITTD